MGKLSCRFSFFRGSSEVRAGCRETLLCNNASRFQFVAYILAGKHSLVCSHALSLTQSLLPRPHVSSAWVGLWDRDSLYVTELHSPRSNCNFNELWMFLLKTSFINGPHWAIMTCSYYNLNPFLLLLFFPCSNMKSRRSLPPHEHTYTYSRSKQCLFKFFSALVMVHKTRWSQDKSVCSFFNEKSQKVKRIMHVPRSQHSSGMYNCCVRRGESSHCVIFKLSRK